MEARLDNLERIVGDLQRTNIEVREERANMRRSLAQLHKQNAAILIQLQEQGATIRALPQNQTHHPPQNEVILATGEGDNIETTLDLEAEAESSGQKNEVVIEKDAQKYRKIEMPTLDGKEPIGWTCQMEQYFIVNGILESEKLDAAIVGLKGRANDWFHWTETRALISDWKAFKAALIQRFHYSQHGDNYDRIAGLKQTRSVTDYIEQFELLSANLTDIAEESLMGMFLNGLKA